MNKFKFSLYTLGLAAAGLMTMTSCSESFLDVSSKTSSDTDNFYRSEGDAWRALIGCYDGWRQIASNPGIGMYMSATVMSDEAYAGLGIGDGRNYEVIDHFDMVESPSDLQIYSTDWKVYYAGVYRCNELITRQDQIDWKSEANKSLYIAEARALRGIMYFDMIRLWGNIPLFLEPSSDNKEQASADDVYAAIAADLKFAIDNIPADANLDEANSGRITKYAVEAMLARVYLFYSGYYKKDAIAYTEGETSGSITKADALAAVEDVIASHKYELVPEFKNLWPAASLVPIPGEVGWNTELSTYAGDNNKEVILAMKFTPTQDYNGNNDSNRWLVMTGARNCNITSKGYGKGWGGATVTEAYANILANDPRYSASIIDYDAEGIASESDLMDTDSYYNWRGFTGKCIKKYAPQCFGNGSPFTSPTGDMGFQECNPQQWVFMRYADVLLMAAELGSSNGQSYLDQVRTRAGLSSIALNQTNIMAERARELAFEGIRYYDLLRQGIDVVADAVMASAGKAYDGGLETSISYRRDKIVATQGFVQIPNDQITLSNGVLKQNPGW